MLETQIYDIAAMCKALGDPTRLRIFEYLRTCCGDFTVNECGEVRAASGPTAGEVCCRITGSERINSTISFHLKELRLAGLITMTKRGKYVCCSVNAQALQALAAFFARERTMPTGFSSLSGLATKEHEDERQQTSES